MDTVGQGGHTPPRDVDHAALSALESIADSAWQYEQHAALVGFAAQVKVAMDRRRVEDTAQTLRRIGVALDELNAVLRPR